jgi:hypothetical protein
VSDYHGDPAYGCGLMLVVGWVVLGLAWIVLGLAWLLR